MLGALRLMLAFRGKNVQSAWTDVALACVSSTLLATILERVVGVAKEIWRSRINVLKMACAAVFLVMGAALALRMPHWPADPRGSHFGVGMLQISRMRQPLLSE